MNTLHFKFGDFESSAHISGGLPGIGEIASEFAPDASGGFFSPLLICDEHTAPIADRICAMNGGAIHGGAEIPRHVLKSGEAEKGWGAVEAILRTAKKAGLGRDGVFIGVGGGVTGDLAAFAASVYMRGCGLVLVSTTLLGMVDASLGGKTGFDLFGVKNLAGTFYPARHVYMPLESLASLPAAEWKSGMAELIKTAVLADEGFLDELEGIAASFGADAFKAGFPAHFARQLLAGSALERCIRAAARFKGGVVAADSQEKTGGRALLNLGHTFAHALEASAGLGAISHGEAVAWGIERSCELGEALGITPRQRARRISVGIAAFGYERGAPHPLMRGGETFFDALDSDKKKKGGKLTFIVPDEKSARQVTVTTDEQMCIIKKAVKGELSL